MIYEMTCRAEQSLLIGDEVEIAILAVEGGQVRLGVTAPEGQRLLRIDPIPLPSGSGDINLFGLARAPGYSRAAPRPKE